MRQLLQRERTEKRRKRRGRAAAALAAVLLVTSLTTVTGSAECKADLEKCVVSISLPSVKADDTSFDEIADVAVVLDFYQVAPAVDLEGYDAYEFGEWNSAFVPASPEKNWEALSKKAKDGTLKAEDLNGFTQSLAAVVLNGTATPAVIATSGTLDAKSAVQVTVPGGMYLVLAHSSQDKTVKDYADEGSVTTRAVGKTKTYHFSPMLVTAPVRKNATDLGTVAIIAGKDKTPIDVSEGYSNTAADSGDWAEVTELVVKVGFSENQNGKLKITKNLLNYEHMEGRNDKATFIYRIEGETYHGVESIVFGPETLTASVIVDHLPIGEEITITELDPFGDYEAASPASVPVTITPSDPETGEGMAEAVFTNRHNGGNKGGGSVKNTYGTASQDEGASWSWISTPQQTIADDTSIRAAG